MLDHLFGFNARLGRLQYLMVCIGLGVAMVAICIALIAFGSIHIPKGQHATWQMLSWPVASVVVLFTLATAMLQAMRVRDIGWDPVLVIAAWFGIVFIDAILGVKLLGPGHYGTILGSIVNLVMTGILLFWPGNDA